MAVTWNVLANTPGGGASAMWLLQDGRVLVHVRGQTQLQALNPGQDGGYALGSWYPVGSIHVERLFFASGVLSDGRIVLCGGEYSGPGLPQTESNACEVYDPVTGLSTVFAPPPGWSNIGDAPSVVLPDGSFMIGNDQGAGYQVALLDPATLSWTIEGGDSDNEQGYVLLQTGDVLTTGVYTPTSMRFNAAARAFLQDAPLPVPLGAASEIGPGLTLMDGRVVWFGTTGRTCLYTPGLIGSSGSWAQGADFPVLPGGLQAYAADSPALLQPNGRVLLVGAFGGATPGNLFLEYDPFTDAFTVLPGAPNPNACQECRLLLLPDGTGLVSTYGGAWYLAKFDHVQHPEWGPTISSLPSNLVGGETVMLSGTQLCGLSEVQTFGDDNQQSEHYPLVRFTALRDGKISYARAHHVDTRSIAPGQSATVLVDVPAFGDPCGDIVQELEDLNPGDFPTPAAYRKAVAALSAQLRACRRRTAHATHVVQVVAMGIASNKVGVRVAPAS